MLRTILSAHIAYANPESGPYLAENSPKHSEKTLDEIDNQIHGTDSTKRRAQLDHIIKSG